MIWRVFTAKLTPGDFTVNIRLLALAAAALALTGSAALAQATSSTTTTVISDRNGVPQAVGVAGTTSAAPVANPPPSTTPPTTANADTGYAGTAHGPAFRDIDDRIAALEARAKGDRSAMAMISKVKGEAKYRRARHGGELRDWDRELLNKQLDQVSATVGG